MARKTKTSVAKRKKNQLRALQALAEPNAKKYHAQRERMNMATSMLAARMSGTMLVRVGRPTQGAYLKMVAMQSKSRKTLMPYRAVECNYTTKTFAGYADGEPGSCGILVSDAPVKLGQVAWVVYLGPCPVQFKTRQPSNETGEAIHATHNLRADDGRR
jgi:hypothetical protein